MQIDSSIPKANGGPRVQINNGNWMPLVGLGTYKIVGQEQVDSAVDAALACGYRHFDTAKLYNNEAELGESIQKFLPKHNLTREDVFITTKFFPVPGNVAAQEVPKLVEESLTNLRTNYLDLVLIHYPKPEENENEDAEGNAASRRECWKALEKIPVEKVHAIGVSNYECRHLEELAGYAKKQPAVNQVEYHPHFRRADIQEYCQENGIFFQAFSSLARQKPELLADPAVLELVEKYKTTPQNVLLSFATSQGVGIVPKSGSAERIKSNFDCLDLQLDDDDLEMLNRIPVDQPYIRCVPWLVK